MDAFKEAFGLIISFDKELYGIIALTLKMSLSSVLISCLIGIPAGVAIGSRNFKGKGLLMKILHTLMGLPPVVAGLIVFLLLSRSGPLGSLKLLFTVRAMVIAQVLLISPIVTGLTASLVAVKTPTILETAAGLRLSRPTKLKLILSENKAPLISVVLTGFGRAISEVGAISLVGGNIQHRTRAMTTAIVLETGKGNFKFAIALGFILIIIAFVINSIASVFRGEGYDYA
ncbi:MAG: ABC transporter permease [Clostridiales bacterium]|nr:ABC transporter permease [Clostridiales bacterium]